MSLDGLRSEGGGFAVLAADHRDSMRAVLQPDAPAAVPAKAITEFKRLLVNGLASGASGVMLDPEYSIPQLVESLPDGVGFTAALEAQGYAADPEAACVRVLEDWSPTAAAASGAAAAKLLVLYNPDRPHAQAQLRAAADIRSECRQAGIPLVLEPLFYALAEPADRFRVVLETVEHFAALEPEVLKLPFPVDPDAETDRGVWASACQAVTARCSVPWVLLSGGGGFEPYRDQVAVAVRAGCSGFMAGRALWGPVVGTVEHQRQSVIRNVVAPRLAELCSLVP